VDTSYTTKNEWSGRGRGRVTVIEIETMTDPLVDAGVNMTVTSQKNEPRRDVARRVRTKALLTPLLRTVHAGVLRGLIPEIVMVIDVQPRLH
jgi:hypothetical protein